MQPPLSRRRWSKALVILLVAAALPAVGGCEDKPEEKYAPGSAQAIKKKQEIIDRVKREKTEAAKEKAEAAAKKKK